MSRWEDTALTKKINFKDPIEALIESQMDESIVGRETESPDPWDSVYDDQHDEPVAQENFFEDPFVIPEDVGTPSNPIPLDDRDNFPPLGQDQSASALAENYRENLRVLTDRIKFLEEENAQLVIAKQQVEERVKELEKAEDSAIPGMSNHVRGSKTHETLSAMVLIDNREVLVEDLTPRMSGWEFSQRVSEVAGGHHRNLLVLQHSTIHPDMPLSQLGLGSRPFYAVSLGERQIERGRSLKLKLMGRGPII